VEPGAVRVRVHTGDLLSEIAAVAFKNCGKLTLVLINNEEVDTLVQLKNTGAHMRVFTTDAVRNYEQTYDGACLSALSLPARSITTVVIKTGI
jgi:O-glycosyl hydrolase